MTPSRPVLEALEAVAAFGSSADARLCPLARWTAQERGWLSWGRLTAAGEALLRRYGLRHG